MGDSESTFQSFMRQQRESRQMVLTAIVGVLCAGLLSCAGVALVVWRDQSIQQMNIESLKAEVVKLEAQVGKLSDLAAELRLAIGVLESRGRENHPERDYAPALAFTPDEKKEVEKEAKVPGPGN